MQPATGTLHVLDSPEALAHNAAQWLLDQALASAGTFVVAMSGGSTPKPVYQALGAPPLVARFPWDRTHWVLGDERFVAPTDKASNYGMIAAALQDAPIPPGHLHQVPTENVTLADAALAYESALKILYAADTLQPERPLFDVCLLGLGDDGHTASLIPGEPQINETRRWVVGVEHGRQEQRLTLTLPALNSSRQVAFLVSGPGKTAILDTILSGGSDLPAARIRPTGTVHWFADRDAAGRWAA